MDNNNGALYFSAGINMNEWRQNITEMRRDILGLSTNTVQQTKQMDTSFRMLGAGLATYFSGAALGNFANQIINVRGEFQKTEIAFGTMLKSTDKAKALMGQMVELAAKTPFSLQDVSAGAKQLLAFQVPAEEVVDTLTRMGNIAAGLGVPLGRINLVYGQVMAKGKLAGDDLRQFTEAGIPLLAELAKKFGTSTAEISKMVSAGKIGFKDVKDVLFSLTNEGGMFFNLMELQSKSLSGQMANLGDAWDQMLNSIGESNQGILSDSIQEAIYLIENYQGVIEVIKGLVITYGAYRAAIIVNTVALRVAAAQEAGLTIAQIARTGATKAATAATALLNATMLANPFVVVTTLLAGLVVVLAKMNSQATFAAELQQKYNDKINEGSATVQTHKAKVEALVTAIKSENTTNEQRKTLLGQLNTLTNGRLGQLTVEEIRTGKATAAIDKYIGALDREARAKAVVELKAENYRRKLELQSKQEPTFGAKAATIFDANTYKDATGKTTVGSVINALTEKSIDSYNRNKDLEIKAIDAKDKEYEAFIRKNGADLVETTKEVAKATDAAAGDGVKNKVKARDLAEVYSRNSIADLEQRIALWNEALQKASGNNVNELTKNKYGDTVKTGNTVSVKIALDELEKVEKAKAARQKEITRLSFDGEIAEIERQWRVRYELAEKYGEEVSKAQFPKLKGDSYYADIRDRFSALDTKLKSGISLSEEDLDKWQKLKSILDNLNGTKDPFTNFKDGLDTSLASIDTYTGRIEYLEKQLYNLTDADIAAGKKSEVITRIEEEKKALKQYYDNFLEDHKSYEEEKSAITKKYDELRQQAKTPEETAKINKAERSDNSRLELDYLKETADWEMAFGDVEMFTKETIDRILANLIRYRDEKGKALEPTEERELAEAILRLQAAASRNPFANIVKGLGEMRKARIAVIQAEQEYQKVLAANNGNKNSDEAIASYKKLTDAEKKAADGKRKFIASVKEGQNIFNAAGDGIMELGDAFGGMSDATKDAIGNIMAIGNAAMDFATSMASGDIAGMIKAGVQLITSVFKAINGDQKKERAIKKQAAAVQELERTYESLAKAIDKAMGEGVFSASQEAINNLKQQKALIEQMMRTEQSKKKADKNKINDFKEQINSINSTIEDLQESLIDKVLNGVDARGLADKLSDALTTAFANGEDAAQAMGKTVDEVLRDMVKNALKMKILEPAMQGVVDKMLASMGYGAKPLEDQIQNRLSNLQKQLNSAKDNKAKANLEKQIADLKLELQRVKTLGSFDGLTDAEREELKKMMLDASTNYTNALKEYESLFGSAAGEAQGLKADIKGVTENTAGALEGQINAMRVNQVENMGVMRSSLLQLSQIEQNTRPISGILNGINELNSKFSKNPLKSMGL